MTKYMQWLIVLVLVVAVRASRLHAWRLTPEEAQSISTDAYVYFFPMVMNYRLMLSKQDGPMPKPFNQFQHQTKLATADSFVVVTPNDDTLYSYSWLDLRAEPVVVSVPEVPQTPLKRYYSMQIVDSFTNNVGIFGSRTTGNHPGNYLIAGPSWTGFEQIEHILKNTVNKKYQCGSNFTFLLGRTLVYNTSDVPNVINIQKGYIIRPLSKFLNSTSPSPLPLPQFPQVDSGDLQSIGFFKYANFIMTYTTIYPDEVDLFANFGLIGIIPGAEYPPEDMTQDVITAIELGIQNGSGQVDNATRYPEGALYRDGWTVQVNPPPYGNHTVMSDRYLTRAGSARGGIYGLDPEEAFYIRAHQDSVGNELDGMNHSYSMTFTPVSMPKAMGFWSVTLYISNGHFYDNPINRYSIGDRTNNLYYNNGILTLYIQHDQPNNPQALCNWLPAPNETFHMITRLYWPTQEELGDPYTPPGLTTLKD